MRLSVKNEVVWFRRADEPFFSLLFGFLQDWAVFARPGVDAIELSPVVPSTLAPKLDDLLPALL